MEPEAVMLATAAGRPLPCSRAHWLAVSHLLLLLLLFSALHFCSNSLHVPKSNADIVCFILQRNQSDRWEVDGVHHQCQDLPRLRVQSQWQSHPLDRGTTRTAPVTGHRLEKKKKKKVSVSSMKSMWNSTMRHSPDVFPGLKGKNK